jgi:hypothetical protein
VLLNVVQALAAEFPGPVPFRSETGVPLELKCGLLSLFGIEGRSDTEMKIARTQPRTDAAPQLVAASWDMQSGTSIQKYPYVFEMARLGFTGS